MRRTLRVHVPRGPLEPGIRVELSREESHHTSRVMRLRVGDRLCVFDGRGLEFEATLEQADPARAVVLLGSQCTDPVEPALTVRLYQGACKLERMAWAVQKATEVGVASVHPLDGERVETRLTERGRERLQRVAVEAAKQSGRRRIPEVSGMDRLPPVPAGVTALLLHPVRGVPALGAQSRDDSPREVWVAVGPEGGFTPQEVEAAGASGWRCVSLGPRTLRSESAGIVGVSLVLHRWGDLGGG